MAGAVRDADGWARLMAEVYPVVRRMVARRIPASLQSVLDADDIVQDALASLLASHGTDEPPTEALLMFGAMQRLTDRMRRSYTMRRGHHWSRVDLREFDPIAPGPSPVDESLAADLVERFAAGRDATEATIIRILAAGGSFYDVAEAIGRSYRTVQRMVRRLRARLVKED